MPKSNSLAETKRGGEGGTFADFLGLLVGFQTCKNRRGRAPRVQEGPGARARGSSSRAGGGRPLLKVQAHLCPRHRRAFPRVAGRRAPPALCREIWEVASAESSYAREHPLPYAQGRCLPCPGCAWGARTRATSRLPRTSPRASDRLARVPAGALLRRWLSAALLCSLPPAGSAMVWLCV